MHTYLGNCTDRGLSQIFLPNSRANWSFVIANRTFAIRKKKTKTKKIVKCKLSHGHIVTKGKNEFASLYVRDQFTAGITNHSNNKNKRIV